MSNTEATIFIAWQYPISRFRHEYACRTLRSALMPSWSSLIQRVAGESLLDMQIDVQRHDRQDPLPQIEMQGVPANCDADRVQSPPPQAMLPRHGLPRDVLADGA